MDIKLTNAADDYATLEITLGPDDYFEVSGYGESGGITIKLPLYDGEAAQLVAKLEARTGAAKTSARRGFRYSI